MPKRLASSALLLLALAGCDVTAVEQAPDTSVVNECGSEQDCPGGVCRNGRCEADGDFSTVLLDIVVPPSGPSVVAGVEYLQRLDNLDLAGEYREVALEPVAHVTGEVTVTGTVPEDCELIFMGSDPTLSVRAGANRTIPADISFTPSDRLLGLPATPYATSIATTLFEGTEPGTPPKLTYAIGLPPNVEYDIYVKPRAAASGGCEIPPRLLRRFNIEPAEVTLSLDMPPPTIFDLTVLWNVTSSQKSLEGWSVDMLDPVTGRLISTRAVLGAPKAMGASVAYDARLLYSPVTLESTMSELVRLSPPEAVDAPTIVLARAVLELFSKGSGVIDQFAGYPEAVEVEGQVALSGSAAPVAATVTLIATHVEGVGAGVFASFQRTVVVGDTGSFRVKLLPGSYRVRAAPTTPGVTTESGGVNRIGATTETEWEIPASPQLQAGKVVEVLPVTHLTGLALAGGDPAIGGTVSALASPAEIQVDLLTLAAEGDQPFAPAAQSSSVGDSGEFDVQADPGVFDISVRPPADSGLPWFVSQVTVSPAISAEAQYQKFGTIVLPWPVPYTGRLSVPAAEGQGVPVPDALIRAFVYLDANGAYTDDPTKASSVVQIGETRADSSGNFELLIPANLN